jgi:hypothetical protein
VGTAGTTPPSSLGDAKATVDTRNTQSPDPRCSDDKGAAFIAG